MRARGRARAVVCAMLAVTSAVALTAPRASAGKKECAIAYVDAQRSMKAGALKKAREQLAVCAHDECLPAVRRDCVAWLDQVNASIPSIVAKAKGPDGKETVDVRLLVDGEVVADKLDVHALELEPGTHKLRFEMAGRDPVEQDVILRQGERNRVIEASFAAKEPPEPRAGAAAPAAATSDPLAASPAPPDKPKGRVLPYVLGGVALAAFAGAGIFWYRAESGRSTLDDAHCAPNCASSDVSAIKRDRLIGDVCLGAGVVLAGLAVYFLVAPGKAEAKRAAWRAWTTSGRFVGPSLEF